MSCGLGVDFVLKKEGMVRNCQSIVSMVTWYVFIAGCWYLLRRCEEFVTMFGVFLFCAVWIDASGTVCSKAILNNVLFNRLCRIVVIVGCFFVCLCRVFGWRSVGFIIYKWDVIFFGFDVMCVVCCVFVLWCVDCWDFVMWCDVLREVFVLWRVNCWDLMIVELWCWRWSLPRVVIFVLQFTLGIDWCLLRVMEDGLKRSRYWSNLGWSSHLNRGCQSIQASRLRKTWTEKPGRNGLKTGALKDPIPHFILQPQ